MNNERLNCVDVEQSDGGDDVELNEAAAPSLSPSMLSNASRGFSAAKLLPGSRQNSKSKILEKLKERFDHSPSGRQKFKHCNAKLFSAATLTTNLKYHLTIVDFRDPNHWRLISDY